MGCGCHDPDLPPHGETCPCAPTVVEPTACYYRWPMSSFGSVKSTPSSHGSVHCWIHLTGIRVICPPQSTPHADPPRATRRARPMPRLLFAATKKENDGATTDILFLHAAAGKTRPITKLLCCHRKEDDWMRAPPPVSSSFITTGRMRPATNEGVSLLETSVAARCTGLGFSSFNLYS